MRLRQFNPHSTEIKHQRVAEILLNRQPVHPEPWQSGSTSHRLTAAEADFRGLADRFARSHLLNYAQIQKGLPSEVRDFPE